ncbi:MAG: sulfurtransferase TusA family protein [Candidatus Helarchaeota archaeon]
MEKSKEIKPAKSIDTVGLYCPVPLFETKNAIETIEVGEILEVLADDPAAESDLYSFAKRTGHEIIKFENDDGILRFLIKRTK